MELVLTIIAGIGILLFLLSYLSYILTGFKHHFVTGLISALPVLNVVTLPALWRKAGKKFMTGLLGLILFAASWFLGADKGLNSITSLIHGNSKKVVTSTNSEISRPLSLPTLPNSSSQTNVTDQRVMTNITKPKESIRRLFLDENKLQGLPSSALYKLVFEPISVDKLNTLKDSIIKVRMNNGAVIEGRMIDGNNNTVLIKSSMGVQEFPIANIAELLLMVRK